MAAAVRARRVERDLTVRALADRAGVSRAMIGKVEAGEAQPTAALLGKLSGALGLTLSELVARAEGADRLVRRVDQPTWTDPTSGYTRRAVSPRVGGALELVEVTMPPHAQAAFAADTYAFLRHQLWVLDGTLEFVEGPTVHRLEAGDCLELGPPADCVYRNPDDEPVRYLVAVTRR
ncbi:helix-turn-helix domain-containing protein [Actinomycetospora termitidis]|uniref:XRE family transcriptional regulator n=1 Tax=Actinomycetospora termitidis TaxID=3053470 RepID=A0ABT7MBE6_9PSEU|nr:XRE family transcriptional regulator [Actinomycetospora sp. Odt1-22]MDL5157332.1 XRE family transcriptional regulator [Actinomycetospora sp. Odt1-22]